MNLFKKIVTYGAIILVSSFGLTLFATASEFSDGLLKANQGDSDYQAMVAKAYMYGEGVQQSDEKAVEWFTKAANQGNVNAQFILGTLYYLGEGVKQNDAKAYEWYLEAVSNRDKDAFSSIKTMYDEGKISQLGMAKAYMYSKGVKQSIVSSL